MREKRALIKEETDTQRLLQEQHGNTLEDVIRIHLATGKVLLNLERKFSGLESANDKLADAYNQDNYADGAEQFQQTSDKDAELMDNVVSRISELKMMKEEPERVHKIFETHTQTTQKTTIDTPGVNFASIWSQSTHGAIRPPQLHITPFDGDVMNWQEFWDQFEASVDKASYSPVDKLNYLKSKLKGEALTAISGYQYLILTILW